MTDRPLLQVESLIVSYGASVAVNEVSLEATENEIIGVFGPNGAGKSSLLKGIVGLVRPNSGHVNLDGNDVTRKDAETHAKQGLALVPEGRSIFGPLSVEENLCLGAYPSGRAGREEMDERLNDAFELFPVLKDRYQQQAGTLSGGEAAMLAVARGLMSRPRVLLLDEPSLGLAPTITARLFERLGSLKETGVTTVIVEQKAAELMDLVDHSLVLRRGQEEHWGPGAIDLSQLDEMYFGADA
ncbi:MAG: ATP-binding cassette domain-containing protein [Acidimicrobiia bacterium]|nr:ATP-binding cassette domain-containing protein [Acidimicrobiia bacterium]